MSSKLDIMKGLASLIPESFRQRLIAGGITGTLALSMGFLYTVEGEVNHVYADVGGVATVCMGSTIFTDKEHYTKQECLELFQKDTQKHLSTVLAVTPQDAPQSVVAAMTSVSYNVGTGGFLSSPMRPLLAAGSYQAACDAIIAPHKTSKGVAKGYRATVNLVPHRGLENRRAKEHALCVSGLQ